MSERELEDVGDGDGSPVVPAVSPRQRWLGPEGRVKRLLLILFLELQFADILSTNHALARLGVWEANPLMALSQANPGVASEDRRDGVSSLSANRCAGGLGRTPSCQRV